MVKKALFFRTEDDSWDLEPLLQCCRNEQFEVEDLGRIPTKDAILNGTSLPQSPVILFIPAIEDDCLGIKLAQDAFENKLPRVIVLYAASMPSREFLCLAFREGIDEIIVLDSDAETLAVKVRRASRLLQIKLSSANGGSRLQQKVDSLHHLCERLEQKDAKWKERLLALSSTATRMATGQLRLVEDSPSLLIVATSNSQAASAAELGRKLGFTPQVVHTAKQALELIEKHPSQVVLTDGTLPDMDVKTFASAVRNASGNKSVIIIAWSSSAETESSLLAPDSNIDDFVLKSASSDSTSLLAAALLGGIH